MCADAGLSSLAAASQLHSLHLCDCRGLTDEGLAVVARLSSLRELNLTNTHISNAGVQNTWTATAPVRLNCALHRLYQILLHSTYKMPLRSTSQLLLRSTSQMLLYIVP